MSYMYLGPGIPGTVKKNQIFTYKPTEVIDKAKAIHPEAGILFIKMSDDTIAKHRREIQTQGTKLNQTFKEVKKAIGGIKK